MKRWQFIALGALVGAATALAGVYLCTRPVVVLWSQSQYLSAASQGRIDVAVLRQLRAGDVAGATDTMERRLSVNEAILSEYEQTFPSSEQIKAVASDAEAVQQYRREFPSPTPPSKSLEPTRD